MPDRKAHFYSSRPTETAALERVFVEQILVSLARYLTATQRCDLVVSLLGWSSEEAADRFGVTGQAIRQSLKLADQKIEAVIGRMAEKDPNLKGDILGLGRWQNRF